MITLYQRTDCPFCWKARLALAELGVGYCTIETTLGEKHPDVVRLSPSGTVPVMVDGDTVIWESGVILEYLDSRYAPAALFGRDPSTAARVRLLHAYSDKIVGGCLKDVIFEKRAKPEAEWDLELIARGEEKWRACQAWLEEALEANPFFGEGYSAADCALVARFGGAQAYGSGVTGEFPGLSRWYESLSGRPSWQAAYPASFIGKQ